MKTIQCPTNLSEKDLGSLARDILDASQNDKTVRIEFSPKDFIVFSHETVTPERARAIPELSQLFSSSIERAASRVMTFSYILDNLLESQGSRSFSKQLYNTGQVIYRFQ